MLSECTHASKKKSLSDREQSQKSGNESRNVISTEKSRKNGIKSEMLSLKRKRTLLRLIGNETVELLNKKVKENIALNKLETNSRQIRLHKKDPKNICYCSEYVQTR